jgi:hypothetical protein
MITFFKYISRFCNWRLSILLIFSIKVARKTFLRIIFLTLSVLRNEMSGKCESRIDTNTGCFYKAHQSQRKRESVKERSRNFAMWQKKQRVDDLCQRELIQPEIFLTFIDLGRVGIHRVWSNERDSLFLVIFFFALSMKKLEKYGKLAAYVGVGFTKPSLIWRINSLMALPGNCIRWQK